MSHSVKKRRARARDARIAEEKQASQTEARDWIRRSRERWPGISKVADPTEHAIPATRREDTTLDPGAHRTTHNPHDSRGSLDTQTRPRTRQHIPLDSDQHWTYTIQANPRATELASSTRLGGVYQPDDQQLTFREMWHRATTPSGGTFRETLSGGVFRETGDTVQPLGGGN